MGSRIARAGALVGIALLVAAPSKSIPTDRSTLADALSVQAAALAANPDPLPFIASLSARIVHGDRDDALNRATLLQRIGRQELVLTCGPAVDVVRLALRVAGIPSRPITLTRQRPHNGFDDGHILLEVLTKQGPVLVDVDQKRLFLINGKPASLASIRRAGLNAVTFAPLGPPARVDPAFALADYERAILANPRPWYERMFAPHHAANP